MIISQELPIELHGNLHHNQKMMLFKIKLLSIYFNNKSKKHKWLISSKMSCKNFKKILLMPVNKLLSLEKIKFLLAIYYLVSCLVLFGYFGKLLKCLSYVLKKRNHFPPHKQKVKRNFLLLRSMPYDCIYSIYSYYNYNMQKTNVGVFVYGDIGRSPRMQNHAIELAKQHEVYFMGYLDTAPRKQITDNPHIHLVDLQIPILGKIRKISFLVYIIIRIFLQIGQILYYLCRKIPNMEFILVQNPPSIPNLMAIWMASCIKKFQIYIDFHNYGYTILGLNVKNRFILKLAERYEKFFGKKCSKAFCVSQKMRDDLFNTWGGIEATVLYDRPLGRRHKQVNRQEFFKKYKLQIPKQGDLLLISSTSWTKDQNFAVLLDAVDLYDRDQYTSRRLRVYITGKGPEKQYYMNKIQQMQPKWSKVSINTVWLEADDYPILLSFCHLGVCLHYSSSGLDLPMKVVDMFQAGIPVLAIKYITLSELVKDGQNGFIFTSTQNLKFQITTLASNKQLLTKITANVAKQQNHTWQNQWHSKFIKPTKQK